MQSPPNDSDRVKSINESAKHVATLTITFLAVCVYVGVAAASTTHEMLLMGRDFTLPLFDAEVSLKPFYSIAPLFLVVLHLHLLLQDYILVTKLVKSPWMGDGLATYFFPELTVSRILGWKYRRPAPLLLKTIRWMVYAVLPVGILLSMQGQFVAYHSRMMTSWHQGLVTTDVILILIFRLMISAQKTQNAMVDGKLGWLHWFSWGLLVLAVIAALLFSCGVAAVPNPQDPDPENPGKLVSAWPFDWPRRNLVARERVLIGRESSAGKGVSLSSRDLTGADFTGAQLINADFRGADLRGAKFVSAVLRGAHFEPARGADGRFKGPPGDRKRRWIEQAWGNAGDLPPTDLEKADFTGADLKGASLILARAAGATLNRADLRGAELTYADLSEARLINARLAGADLWHGIFQRADLSNADLRAADLSFAELEGAVLELARLTAANLSNAKLAGAWFAQADLRGAELGGALATGASFRGAFLQSSRGLQLVGISLRQASLDFLCQDLNQPAPSLVGFELAPPSLVDFRGVVLPDSSQIGKFWRPSSLDGAPAGPLRDAAFRRLKNRPVRPSCTEEEMPPIPAPSLRHRGLLYNDERRPDPLKDWPLVADQAIQAGTGWTEDDFYSALAVLWVERSCSSESTARAMDRLVTKPPSLAEKELLAALKSQLGQRFEEARQYEADLQDGMNGAGVTDVGRPCPVLLALPEEIRRRIKSLTAPAPPPPGPSPLEPPAPPG